jgi:hypothetical protein
MHQSLIAATHAATCLELVVGGRLETQSRAETTTEQRTRAQEVACEVFQPGSDANMLRQWHTLLPRLELPYDRHRLIHLQ